MSDENLTNIPPFQHQYDNEKILTKKNIIIVCIINVL